MLIKLTAGLSDDELSKFPNVFHQAWHHGRKKYGRAESLLEESTGQILKIFYLSFKWKFIYRAFHGFGQAKFPNGGLALDSSQFSILPKLHQETILASKGVKIDSNISNSSL